MIDPASPAPGATPGPVLTSLANPPFTAGKAIGDAFRVFRRNAFAFGGVAVALFAPAIAVEMATVSAPDSSGAWRLGTTLWNVLGCLVTAALTHGALAVLDGRTPTVSSLFGAGFGRGLRVLGASMLVGLLTVLGLILLVIPGLIAAAGLYVTTTAVVAEPERSIRASIERSWSLTRGHRWAVLGIGVLFLSIALAVSFGQGVAVEVMGEAAAGAVTAVGGIVMSMALGLQSVAAAVTYHALRAEKEGVAPHDLGAVFE
jgi:hypothetical protein